MNKILSRRSFFGASAGAAVAAPKLAQSLTDVASAGQSPNLPVGWGSTSTEPCQQNESWLVDELRSALKYKARVKSDLRMDDHSANQVERFRLDSMRSLSPATRARLAFEDQQRRSLARELGYVEERIAKLKEQLGPLASIVMEE